MFLYNSACRGQLRTSLALFSSSAQRRSSLSPKVLANAAKLARLRVDMVVVYNEVMYVCDHQGSVLGSMDLGYPGKTALEEVLQRYCVNLGVRENARANCFRDRVFGMGNFVVRDWFLGRLCDLVTDPYERTRNFYPQSFAYGSGRQGSKCPSSAAPYICPSITGRETILSHSALVTWSQLCALPPRLPVHNTTGICLGHWGK